MAATCCSHSVGSHPALFLRLVHRRSCCCCCWPQHPCVAYGVGNCFASMRYCPSIASTASPVPIPFIYIGPGAFSQRGSLELLCFYLCVHRMMLWTHFLPQTMEAFTQLVRDVSITGLSGVQLPALAVMKSACFCIAAILSAPAPYVSIPSRVIRHIMLCTALCFSHMDRDYAFPVRPFLFTALFATWFKNELLITVTIYSFAL